MKTIILALLVPLTAFGAEQPRPAFCPPLPEMIEHPEGAETFVPPAPIATGTSPAECYTNHLLRVAEAFTKDVYKNVDPHGLCADAIGYFTHFAGVNPCTKDIGDAYPIHGKGTLKAMGFKDIFKPGMKPDDAPEGAILVFDGPGTASYVKAGFKIPPKPERNGLGAGNWVGHISMAGKKSSPRFYLSDGRSEKPARSDRTLVAVYVIKDCPYCSPLLKKVCGQVKKRA